MRILWILAVLLLTNVCYAQDAIYTTADGTKIMCTASKSSGSLSEYDNFTDYYTFKNGHIYSDNLSKMFGNPSYTKKVLKLKIDNNKISFKDRLYRWKAFYYKYVTIDRQTGKYTFEAKKDNNWYCFFPRAYGSGTCSIIE